ncbi:hypothetical protein Q73A0000_02545 [Kaistella flava (ex Peng et al. 2021)]|uniref:Uncharacterized protein n=1 Tax=Kaistella flava (ex Peng et al. 2021) TaxID=2038776 RepID=A0A7M2Y6L2_9FLAO|nr:hypothetical protein [Kaistella flava (ex Peng et al. 2021)]QOW09314.1 hypothetical protein Q73A0000_02545 [Kaistella flava (ex Peng et al. 2021)]
MNVKKKILIIISILFCLNIIVSLIIFLFHSFPKNRIFEIQNLSTIQQWAILIGALLLFVTIGNMLIHIYYKKQHKKILNQIRNEKYEIFKNIVFTQTWNFGFRINRADLILIESEIIVLIYNVNFNGLIKQAQPAILFYKDSNSQKIKEGISNQSKIGTIFSTTCGFKITGKVDTLFKKQNLNFSFETNQNQKNQIVKILIENKLI